METHCCFWECKNCHLEIRRHLRYLAIWTVFSVQLIGNISSLNWFIIQNKNMQMKLHMQMWKPNHHTQSVHVKTKSVPVWTHRNWTLDYFIHYREYMAFSIPHQIEGIAQRYLHSAASMLWSEVVLPLLHYNGKMYSYIIYIFYKNYKANMSCSQHTIN